MENLEKWNLISKYKFGILDFNEESNEESNEKPYLKFKDDNNYYILSNSENPDVIVIKSINETVLKFDDFELEIELYKNYFLKPAIKFINIDNFIVKKYSLLENLKVNVISDNQLKFFTELFYDTLNLNIGNKKLKMSCWPFKNININDFLEECKIPYKIILNNFDNYYLYEDNFDNKIDPDNSYYIEGIFEKVTDVSVNGKLFCDCNNLQKKINLIFLEIVYNGSSLTSGSTESVVENEDAFIIFNPDVATNTNCEEERVLPLEFSKCYEKFF
jgi:hypothetical protein